MNSKHITNENVNTNPVVESNDWFVREFRKIVFIVDPQYSEKLHNLHYNIDYQYNCDSNTIKYSIFNGISPLAQLQYWYSLDDQDNILKQLESYKIYNNDNITLKSILTQSNQSFTYIENTKIKYNHLKYQDNNTIIMIFTYSQLFIVTQAQYIGEQVLSHLQQTIYSIDSITSTISALLDIPIPYENYGVLLPGLIYKTNDTTFNNNPIMIQIDEYLLNSVQLYQHYVAAHKTNYFHSSYQQELEHYAAQFAELSESSDDQLKIQLLTQLYALNKNLSHNLNSLTSANVLVMLIGVSLTIASIYFIRHLIDTESTLFYIALFLVALFQFKFIYILLYAYLSKQITKILILNILLCIIASYMPLPYQLICLVAIFQLKELTQIPLSNFKSIIPIVISIILSQFYNIFIIVALIMAMINFKQNYHFILFIFSLCFTNNLIFIPLCLIQGDRNLQQLLFVYYITLLYPQLPMNPLILQISPYYLIFDMINFIVLQQLLHQFNQQHRMTLNDNVLETIYKIYNIMIDYNPYLITTYLIQILYLLLLILYSVFASDLKKIGNQYFIFQYSLINIIFTLLPLIPQPDQQINQLETVQITDTSEDHQVMKEIEL